MKEKNENTEAYPRPSSSDEQLRSQDEFATQKPNEKAPNNSDLPQPAIKEPNTVPGDEQFDEGGKK